jgi:hypothetical protein
MAIHGDILELSVAHSKGNRTFFAKAAEGNTLNVGGVQTVDDTASVTTAGTPMFTMNRVAGSLQVLIENDMNVREDQIFLQGLAGETELGEWTFSMINGSVWRGSGKPVGAIDADTNAGTIALKLVVGNWKKIQ